MKIFLSLLIICATHLSNGFKTPPEKRSWHHQGLGSPSIPPGVEVPPDQWFVQLLDHFKPTDDRTWWVSRNERMQKFCRGDNFLGFSRGPSIRVRKPQKATWNQKTATLWIQGSGQVALCPPGPLPDSSLHWLLLLSNCSFLYKSAFERLMMSLKVYPFSIYFVKSGAFS